MVNILINISEEFINSIIEKVKDGCLLKYLNKNCSNETIEVDVDINENVFNITHWFGREGKSKDFDSLGELVKYCQNNKSYKDYEEFLRW